MHQSSTAERGHAAVGSERPAGLPPPGRRGRAAHGRWPTSPSAGWVAYRSFFYADDYTLLAQARATGLDAGYLGLTRTPDT